MADVDEKRSREVARKSRSVDPGRVVLRVTSAEASGSRYVASRTGKERSPDKVEFGPAGGPRHVAQIEHIDRLLVEVERLQDEVEALRAELDEAWDTFGGREAGEPPRVEFGPAGGPHYVVQEGGPRTLGDFLRSVDAGVKATREMYLALRAERDVARAAVEAVEAVLDKADANPGPDGERKVHTVIVRQALATAGYPIETKEDERG